MRLRFSLLLCLGFLAPLTAHAEEWQFWPEVDVYWSVRKDLRLLFIYGATREPKTQSRTDYAVAGYVDFLALQHRPLAHFTPDAAKNSRLDIRVGYLRNVDDGTESVVDEHRYVGQFQARFHPVERPLYFFNRNRFELRDVEGRDLSWRYRNRSRLEDNIQWLGQNLTPYGTAEFFWDSRRESWSRAIYAIGCELAFPYGHTVLDLGLNLQDEWATGVETIWAPNLTLNLFF